VETADDVVAGVARRREAAVAGAAPSRRAHLASREGTALIVLYVLSPIDLILTSCRSSRRLTTSCWCRWRSRFLLGRLPPGLRGEVERQAGR
jgi:hypothetical protein